MQTKTTGTKYCYAKEQDWRVFMCLYVVYEKASARKVGRERGVREGAIARVRNTAYVLEGLIVLLEKKQIVSNVPTAYTIYYLIFQLLI